MKEEIMSEVFEELMVPEYINTAWLKEQPAVVYRLDRSGHRYYYTIDDDGEPTFFVSVTTFIKNSLPTSPFLIEWMKQNGDDAKEIADIAAHHGTFLHIQCGELLQNASYDLDTLRFKMEQYAQEHHLPQSFLSESEEIKKDVLAFAQFMIDYNVIPIAIEIVLTDPEYGVAGAIDIVCELDVVEEQLSDEVFKSGPRKGQKKTEKVKVRKVAIVDIKRGRKGFWESHEIQLAEYGRMWGIHFPDIPISKLYNWSPKDWRSAPSYNLKDQTNAKSARKLPHMIEIARIEDERKNNSLNIYHGIIDIKNGLYANVENIELSELVRNRHTLDLDEPNS